MHVLRLGMVVVAVVLGWPSSLWAWGDVGHKIVCEIAFHELNDTARAKVTELIGRDPEFQSFADSCIWPDHPKRRRVEHFLNVERTVATVTSNECPPGAAPCLLSAIQSDVAVLAGSASDEAKLAALKFLGHWMGDLHQPLHVSFADDQGGNKIKETGPCDYNLHAVWDNCIIAKVLGTDPQEVALILHEEITDVDRAKWQGDVEDVHKWATESLQITRRADVRYCVKSGQTCRYDAQRTTFEGGTPEKTAHVDQQYLKAHARVVRLRLQQAGVRLAHLLNKTLGQ